MDLCVFVMRYDPDGPSAEPVSAGTDISRNTVAFTLVNPGLYDIIAVLKPSPEPPAEPAAPAPEEPQPEPQPEEQTEKKQ